jgi:hypothetical protein
VVRLEDGSGEMLVRVEPKPPRKKELPKTTEQLLQDKLDQRQRSKQFKLNKRLASSGLSTLPTSEVGQAMSLD